MEDLIEQWLYFAEQDFSVAKHLFDCYYPKPLEIICYHCQQAAEKSIKAVIISYDAPGGIPKSHDLVFLLNQIKKVASVEDIYRGAVVLTPYGVTARYPGNIELEEHNAAQAIEYARDILVWAKKTVNNA